MKKCVTIVCSALAVAAATAALAVAAPRRGPAGSPPGNSTASEDVKVVVTVRGSRGNAGSALNPDDVLVYQNDQRRPVVDWQPVAATQTGLDLAILVDDALDTSVGNQLGDLKNFIRQLPPSSRVAVAYGMYGGATMMQDFTTDRGRAAETLRLPEGRISGGSSIYMSLTDLLKGHWPASQNRRAVLVISDGLDLYYGVTDSQAPLNPDLQQAIDRAQREDVTVYTLFANGAGRSRGNLSLLNNGQDCLSVLASATGGESYFQGLETPLAFAPFLEKLATTLGQQYVLTFRAETGNAPRFDRLRISTEQPGVKLEAPQRVFVPAPAG